MFVVKAFAGTRNDSSMAELYSAVLTLSQQPFSDLKWTTSDGVEHQGLYFIVDGGYSGWSTLMAME